MVKHSVRPVAVKCCADFFIPMLSAPRSLPRPRCCSLYLLQCVWLVAGADLAGLESRTPIRLCASTRVSNSGKAAPIAGTPESLRSEATTGLPSAGRAGHLRVRDGYDQDRSPLYYLVAAAPLLLRLRLVVAGIVRAPARRVAESVLRRHARKLRSGTSHAVSTAMREDTSRSRSICFSPAMIVNVAGAQSSG